MKRVWNCDTGRVAVLCEPLMVVTVVSGLNVTLREPFRDRFGDDGDTIAGGGVGGADAACRINGVDSVAVVADDDDDAMG